jgi:hypothetical protein
MTVAGRRVLCRVLYGTVAGRRQPAAAGASGGVPNPTPYVRTLHTSFTINKMREKLNLAKPAHTGSDFGTPPPAPWGQVRRSGRLTHCQEPGESVYFHTENIVALYCWHRFPDFRPHISYNLEPCGSQRRRGLFILRLFAALQLCLVHRQDAADPTGSTPAVW